MNDTRQLDEIASIIGQDGLLELAEAWGGGRLYIPESIRAGNRRIYHRKQAFSCAVRVIWPAPAAEPSREWAPFGA